MEDKRIVALYRERNTDAVKESSQKYGGYCFAIANRILHCREDAEECLNDTWLHAWNAIPPARPDNLQLFLAKIVRNLSFDRYSARTAEKRGGGEADLVLDELAECIAAESDVAKEYENRQLGIAIRRFVGSLPERECNLFLRRYFYTEAVGDIAARYHLTENHVAVILSRTRKKLKKYLIKEGLMDESF